MQDPMGKKFSETAMQTWLECSLNKPVEILCGLEIQDYS